MFLEKVSQKVCTKNRVPRVWTDVVVVFSEIFFKPKAQFEDLIRPPGLFLFSFFASTRPVFDSINMIMIDMIAF